MYNYGCPTPLCVYDMYEPHASHFTLPSGQAAREREREQWRLEHMYDMDAPTITMATKFHLRIQILLLFHSSNNLMRDGSKEEC